MRAMTRLIAAIATGLLLAVTPRAAGPGMADIAWAQDSPAPRENGADAIRRRQVEQESAEGDSTSRYWTPFDLARDGRCGDAMDDLRRMANRGRGYENAQHTYGLCLLETGTRIEGLTWIARAAQAGLADAQATHLRLYAKEGTTYLSHKAAAMWLYLYENNPLRYRVGASHALDAQTARDVRASIPRADYLEGIDMARNWTPDFWSQAASAPGENGHTSLQH